MENIKIFACNSLEKLTNEIRKCLVLPLGQKDSFKFKNDNTFVQLKKTVRNQDIHSSNEGKPLGDLFIYDK